MIRSVPAKVRFRKDRETWEVVVHKEGERIRKSFGRGLEAEQKARQFAALLNDELAASERFGKPGALPIDRVLRDWLNAYRSTLAHSTEQTSRGLIENHLIPYFGDRDLRDLSEIDVIKFTEHCSAKGVSIHIPRRALSILTRVLNLHVREGSLSENPLVGAPRLLAKIRKRQTDEINHADAWTLAELETMLTEAESREPWLYPMLVFLSHTGARRGELIGLRWEDIDFERGRIWLRRAVVRGRVTTPKSGKARSVPMDAAGPRLRRVLEDLARIRPGREGIATRPAAVFRSPKGSDLLERNLSRAWERFRSHFARLGVRPLRLHCLRHTFATQALEAGVSIQRVAAWLGHSTTRVTEIYSHVVPDEEPAAFLSRGPKTAPNGPKILLKKSPASATH